MLEERKENGDSFYDLEKRLCAIRETFEETNILLGNSSFVPKGKVPEKLNQNEDFSIFCKNTFDAIPAIKNLNCLIRLASPIGIYPPVDSLFYIYFCRKSEIESEIKLNKTEFTEHTWLKAEEAIRKNFEEGFPLFFPTLVQLACLSQFKTGSELK